MKDTEPTMRRISVMVPEETRTAIDRIASENKDRGWTHSSVVREALADFVQKEKDADRLEESLREISEHEEFTSGQGGAQ